MRQKNYPEQQKLNKLSIYNNKIAFNRVLFLHVKDKDEKKKTKMN